MNTAKIVSNQDIEFYLNKFGWDKDVDNGRLMLLELISKAGAGCYNSHTEELFLSSFRLLRADRMPNRRGMTFICSMVYASSHSRPFCFKLMKQYRK